MRRLRRWRLAVIALMAAFAVTVTANTASAAQPGEDDHFHLQNVVPGQDWRSRDVPSVATSTLGAQLRFWRADDASGSMWLSLNGGNAYQIDGATTMAPIVVPWGAGGFYLFHTGIDGQVYYRFSSNGANGSWNSPWTPVRGADGVAITTPLSVSVTTLGSAHPTQMYMVFRSNDSRRAILGMFYNGSSWTNAANLGGVTDHSPSVSWNNPNHNLNVVHTGTDTHVYLSSAAYGTNPGGVWESLGGNLDGHPTIATTANGYSQISGIAAGAPWYYELGPVNQRLSEIWERDSSDTASLNYAAIFLGVAGNVISAYIRNPGDFIYAKTSLKR